MIRMESPFLTSGLFNRYKWWPPQRVLESDETALIAADPIPVGTSSQPFSTSLNLRRILDTKPIQTILGVHVDRFGLLSVESLHVEWIPLIRLAENCEEQNVEAVIAEKRDAVVLRSTKNIQVGQELKVWFSTPLLQLLQIPFLNPSNIINHEVYRCSNCHRTFNQPNPLKVHKSFECPSPHATLVHGPSPCLPVTAQAISSRFTQMRREKETREPKTHVCLFCGKLYTRKYGLKIHLRTHTGHKPLQCRFCGRAFSDPSNLNKHIRLHSHQSPATFPPESLSSSPYKCSLCGKVLVRRRDLDRHMRSRHANSRYS